MCLAELTWCLREENRMPILSHQQLLPTGPGYTMMRHDNIFRPQFDGFWKAKSRLGAWRVKWK